MILPIVQYPVMNELVAEWVDDGRCAPLLTYSVNFHTFRTMRGAMARTAVAVGIDQLDLRRG